MLQNEHLDVRAVTLGIDLFSCADRDPETLCRLAREKILRHAGGIQEACQRAVERYGIPIVNRRIALSPVAPLVAEHEPETLLRFARMLDAVAEEAGVDFIGGWTAHVQKGMTLASRALIDSLPDVLSETTHLCASVNAASSHAGINMDALLLLGRKIREMAERTADRRAERQTDGREEKPDDSPNDGADEAAGAHEARSRKRQAATTRRCQAAVSSCAQTQPTAAQACTIVAPQCRARWCGAPPKRRARTSPAAASASPPGRRIR